MRLVQDDLGGAVTVPAEPARLVSLVPSISEVLWWWRLADRVVGVTDWCVAPPRAFEHARRVRGTKNPDVAAIVDLTPDLVIADQEENRELDVRRLRDAGVAVYVTRVRGLGEAADALARLGDVLGCAAAGLALRQSILRACDQVRAPARPLPAACPIWRDGAAAGADETWWVVGDDTYAAGLLAACGFRSVLGDPSGPARYPRLPLDAFDPAELDVVLLPDEPFAFGHEDAEVLVRRGLRVRHLDGTALTWWGPRTTHALGDLSRLARQLDRSRRRDRTPGARLSSCAPDPGTPRPRPRPGTP